MTMMANRNDDTVVPAPRRRAVGDWDVRANTRLETARQWLDSGGNVLVHGPSAESTTAGLNVITACRLERVLRCRPHSDERYATLARLLESVSGADLELIPKPRQGVLIAVLAGQVRSLAPTAVQITVLNLVRQMARQRPVLMVIDHIERVDPDSAEVLRYLVPRVQDLPVRMAVAEQTSGMALPRHRQLCPSPLLVVRLPATGQPA